MIDGLENRDNLSDDQRRTMEKQARVDKAHKERLALWNQIYKNRNANHLRRPVSDEELEAISKIRDTRSNALKELTYPLTNEQDSHLSKVSHLAGLHMEGIALMMLLDMMGYAARFVLGTQYWEDHFNYEDAKSKYEQKFAVLDGQLQNNEQQRTALKLRIRNPQEGDNVEQLKAHLQALKDEKAQLRHNMMEIENVYAPNPQTGEYPAVYPIKRDENGKIVPDYSKSPLSNIPPYGRGGSKITWVHLCANGLIAPPTPGAAYTKDMNNFFMAMVGTPFNRVYGEMTKQIAPQAGGPGHSNRSDAEVTSVLKPPMKPSPAA